MAANVSRPSPAPDPWARFDDVPAGSALRFPTPHRVLTATRPSEVVPLLAELDRATRAGAWAFGYLGYEAAAGLDPGLAAHSPSPDGPPVAWFGLCTEPRGVPLVTAPTPAGPDGPDAPDAPNGPNAHAPDGMDGVDGPWEPSWTPERYRAGVERVREHIAAGQTYQLNLTVRLRRRFTGEPRRLYADLALAQRARYCAYLDLGRHVVASASPELFLHWRGDLVTTRPMKGTAPRGRHSDEDDGHAHRLRTSAKERAENVMIVDLMRNDLARIARTGGVSVGSLCALERYPTVLQLTSEVTARLRPEVGLPDVVRALFPCGSVTGAPKSATMRLIRELEDEPRGVYCGAIGWVGPPTAPIRARFSVAIRTAVVDREARTACYGSGGGITWSSRVADEHAELLVKAAVLGRQAAEFELLETMGHHPGAGLRNLEGHLRRLADSAGYFGFELDLAEARMRLAGVVPGSAGALVRLRLARSGAITVRAAPLPAPLGRPVRLELDPEPMDTGQPWPFHKTSLRAPYTDRADRHPGADDVLLCNERGELTEATIANLAVRLDGRWWTPPVSSGCLPGVERARLVRRGVLAEGVLRPDDLTGAEGVALVSSLRGWRPAVLGGG